MNQKLKNYLLLIMHGGTPSMKAWGEQARDALSNNYVRCGWGGRLELTSSGKSALISSHQDKEP